MPKKIVFLCLAIILIGLSVLTFSCKTSGSGTTLVFGRSGDSVGLDPAKEDDGESFYIADNIYEGLVAFKPGTTEVIPCLAEKWSVSDDGLEFTFNLRKDVTFHDGTKFTADAVVFSLKRQYDTAHPFNQYGPWKYWGYMDMSNIVNDVVKVDDYTVKISLKKREAPFLANLAMNFAVIVSPAAAEKYKENFGSNPSGTGPFKFVNWAKDDSIVIERNNKYWGKKAKLERVIFKVITEATTRYLSLKKGEVDIIDFPSPESLEEIAADPNLKTVETPGLNIGYLAMNERKKPFDNLLVRQAINMAINKDDIIKAVYGKMGTKAKNPIPPIMWSYNDSITDYEYNPEKAKALLTEAGLAGGFKTTLWAMPVSRPYNPNAKKVAEIIQDQLKKINITAEIVSYEWGTYLDKISHGEHDMCLIGWTGDNGDPDNFLWILLSGDVLQIPTSNYAFWNNRDFTETIKEAKETFDPEKRKALYMKAQEIFKDDAPWVPIAHSMTIEPMKKSVMGFILSPVGKRQFQEVWIEK